MIKGDRISCIFWLIFSLLLARESYRLGLGTIHSPDAGFLPFWASMILGALSIIQILLTVKVKRKILDKDQSIEEVTFNWKSSLKVSGVIIILFVYAVLLNTLGFMLDTIILIGFLLMAIEPQKWYVVVIGAISASFGAFLIFDVFLKVQMPKGIFSF